jgi:hypothetical protein
MWYDRGYENTSLHPTFDRTRTSPDPSRLTLQRRLCLTKSSGPARIRSRGTCSSDLPTIRVPQTNSTQYPPRLQCRWLSRLRGRLFASPSTTNDLSRRSVRGTTGSATSQSPRLWPRYQCVDVIPGSPDQLPTGPHFQTCLWRECAPRSQTFRKELETGQTLDHQPRPAIPGKKKARDRLICWCSQQPGWAIGFLDEVWWSRFALPSLNAWQDKDEPVHLGGTGLAKA